MRRISGTAGFLSFVCFCLDCYRANRTQASLGYFAALFVADIWGFIPYTLLTLGKRNYGDSGSGPVPLPQKRTQQIFWRLVFLIVALIAPCMELANAGSLNSDLTSSSMSQAQLQGILVDKMSDNAIVGCWGAVGAALRAAAKYSPDEDAVLGICGALQARTIIMLIVSFFVLVETILYARSNVGTEAWVQEQLEKTASPTAVGPAETIEMAPPAYPVVYSVPTHTSPAPYTTTSPYSPPTVVDHQTPDLERVVVQAV